MTDSALFTSQDRAHLWLRGDAGTHETLGGEGGSSVSSGHHERALDRERMDRAHVRGMWGFGVPNVLIYGCNGNSWPTWQKVFMSCFFFFPAIAIEYIYIILYIYTYIIIIRPDALCCPEIYKDIDHLYIYI